MATELCSCPTGAGPCVRPTGHDGRCATALTVGTPPRWPYTTPTGHTYLAPASYRELVARHGDAIQADVESWNVAEHPPPPSWEMVSLAHDRVQELVQAMMWTVEYVGLDRLPDDPGWPWYDALRSAPDFDVWLERLRAASLPSPTVESTPVGDTPDDVRPGRPHAVAHLLLAAPGVRVPRFGRWLHDHTEPLVARSRTR